MRISLEQVNSWRLNRNHLTHKARKRELALVISDVCGIQAQVLTAAELGIRARVNDINQRDVRDALWKDHSIVKTWCMRGTLHLLATSDLPLYVAALKSKLDEAERWLQRDGGIAPTEVSKITDKIKAALSGRPLTREELSREVERKTPLNPKTRRYLRSAWGVLLRPAAYHGYLAFGESLGPKVTFVNPAKWIKPWKEPTVRDAMLELFRRFLRTYGPVNVNDFSHWWGGLGDDDRSALGPFMAELEQVELEGSKGLMLRSDAKEACGLEPIRSVHLLPSFDCYPMFYSPRELFVPKIHRGKIFRQTAGWNYPSLVVNGLAAGIWSLRKKSRVAEIGVELFRSLSAQEKAGVQEEGEDIARFLDSGVEIRYQPTVKI